MQKVFLGRNLFSISIQEDVVIIDIQTVYYRHLSKRFRAFLETYPDRKACYGCLPVPSIRKQCQSCPDRGDLRRFVLPSEAWDQAKEKTVLKYQARRAREGLAEEKAGGRTHTKADEEAILRIQGDECYYCGVPLPQPEAIGKGYSVDHLWPLMLGGSDDPENLAIVCLSCNARKGPSPASEYWDVLIKEYGRTWVQHRKEHWESLRHKWAVLRGGNSLTEQPDES